MANYINQVERLTKELQGLQPLSIENQLRLDKKMRLEFNYNSNHMEGNTLTYSETELLLIFDDTKGNHTMREYEEMRGHDVAFRLITEWSKEEERPLTEQNIKNLNEIILVRPFWKEAITSDGQPTRRQIQVGNYKEHPNSVRLQNGEIFNYAPPAETPFLMKELIDWYRAEEKAIHPITLAAMLHYKFVRIHPFDDGNGRVARLIMNYVLLKNGYPPVIIKSADKQNYLRVLRLADVEDYEPLISYIEEQLVWSLSVSLKAAKGESVDEPGDLDKKIKALKQRLNTSETAKVKITKSKKAIIQAYETGIDPLITNLSDKLSEFGVLFKSFTEALSIHSVNKRYPVTRGIQSVTNSINNFSETIEYISYNYVLIGLRKVKNKNFKVEMHVNFLFHKNIYELESESIKTSIEKLYDEAFSEAEVNAVVEEIGNYLVEKIDKEVDKK